MTGTAPVAQDELLEAYERLHRYGPEFAGDEEGNHGLTNHAPMAAEVIIRRGLPLNVDRWLDRYVRRLDERPAASRPIDEDGWRAALGDPRRLPDWTAAFTKVLRDEPWPDVLATWWPRLLPGIVAGSTHGVIRVGHAVRTLRVAGPGTPPAAARNELANGLAFWAARYRELPGAADPIGHLPITDALAGVPRLTDQTGLIAHRLERLGGTPGWPASLRALRPATAEQVPARLADLIDAAGRSYLSHGYAAPVLLVHTATAPNAVLHTLPALPASLWPASFDAAWTAVAAITGTYAPRLPAPHSPPGRALRAADAAEVLVRAADHGDEHVIKFADTVAEAYERTQDTDLLAAAVLAANLIAAP